MRPAPCSWPGLSHQGQKAGGQGELCVLAPWLLLWCMGLGIWLPAEPRLEKKGKSHICWSSSSCSYCSFPHSISQESPPALPDCLKHIFPKKKINPNSHHLGSCTVSPCGELGQALVWLLLPLYDASSLTELLR